MTSTGSLTDEDTCDLVRVAVQFLVYSDHLSPNEISTILDLEPTRSVKKGVKYGPKTRTPIEIPHHMWQLSSESHVPALDFSSHLDWLLCRLTPRRGQIHALQNGGVNECNLIGIVWSSVDMAHVRITAEQMAAISDLRLDIELEFADYGDHE
jgi:hypothetical protein